MKLMTEEQKQQVALAGVEKSQEWLQDCLNDMESGKLSEDVALKVYLSAAKMFISRVESFVTKNGGKIIEERIETTPAADQTEVNEKSN
jgi:hypothetical protein